MVHRMRASEAGFQASEDITRIGFWDRDVGADLITWSDEAYRIFGLPQEGRPLARARLRELVHPDDLPRVDRAVAAALEGGGARFDVEYRVVRPDGEVRLIHSQGHVTRDDSGRPFRMFGTVQDITERWAQETRDAGKLRLAQERLELGLRGSKVGIWSIDMPEGDYLRGESYFGDVWEQLGYEEAPKDVESAFAYAHPDDVARVQEAVDKYLSGETAEYEAEFRMRRRDGSYRSMLARGAAVRDPAGKPIRFVGLMIDITNIREVEQVLRRQANLLRLTYDAIVVWRLDGGIESWSRGAEELYGYTEAEALGRVTHELLHTVHPIPWSEIKAKLAAGETWEGELRHRTKAGDEVIVATRHLLVRDSDGVQRVLESNFDLTARKRAEEELAAAKTAAEEATEAKSRFLASMSHELRTPMNAILGMIDVALPKATDATVRDCLQTAKESADLLLTLLNDLLDSAKIEFGKLELETVPFSLRRMLDQIARLLSVRASVKGLSFSSSVEDDTPDKVIGDWMRLRQVLLNLSSNAIKFTERGSVDLSVRKAPQEGEGWMEFAVRDTGIGIAPSGLEHLFQPFDQADVSMTRRYGGTGLGLSISKSLVEMMGGRIWAESEEGEGSTFYFTVRLPVTDKLPPERQLPETIPEKAPRQLRILLAEDNSANRKLATYLLQDRGHVVEVAEDGQEALDREEQGRYDAILMDIQMPIVDGLEATAAIRGRERGVSRRVPIIGMTAHAMESDRQRCLAAGMDGYLAKPINAQEMIHLVESLAGGDSPVPDVSTGASAAPKGVSPSDAAIFDPDEALARCFNDLDGLRNFVQLFLEEVETLFPQMRDALAVGDLIEIGRLGHRIKGTVIYLAAHQAEQAALAVERFLADSGTPAEAAQAVDALERECLVLAEVLREHPLANEPALDESALTRES